MKYNVGDIIIYTRHNQCIAEIIEINQYEYKYRYIKHSNTTFINNIFAYDINHIDQYTRLLTPEDKLELL